MTANLKYERENNFIFSNVFFSPHFFFIATHNIEDTLHLYRRHFAPNQLIASVIRLRVVA